MERRHCLLIGDRDILGTTAVFQERMLRTYSRVIQARRDALGAPHLAVLVLEHVCHHAVKDSLPPLEQWGRVPSLARPSRLDAYEPHRLVALEGVEAPHGVAAPSDAGDDCVG